MSRGKSLSESEKAVIQKLIEEGKSQRAVARLIGRSRNAVKGALQPSKIKNKRGAKKKITKKTERVIIRRAAKGDFSARQLRNQFCPEVSIRTVQRLLNDTPWLEYTPPKKAHRLSELHRKNRIKWCRDKLLLSKSWWKNVVFSDEKKFNLDGPDWLNHYSGDERADQRICSQRKFGDESVTVWGCFSWRGAGPLVEVTTNLNHERYIKLLEDDFLPYVESNFPSSCVFQQDNASYHAADATKKFIFNVGIDLLDWPAISPDLNPIENLWGVLVRDIYAGSKQYEKVNDLKKAIWHSWRKVGREYCKNLIQSMPRRCIEVLDKRGATIDC